MSSAVHVWDLWYPEAGSQGVSFARGMTAPTPVMLVHAAPPVLRVEVRDGDRLVARGDDLRGEGDMPIIRLRIDGDTITRETLWPTEADHGTPVLLPGGEVGVLRSWWNDDARREWRWTVEFYNHR